MADPKNSQRADEELIGKPHGEPDEIGKAHGVDEDHDDDVGTPLANKDQTSFIDEETRTGKQLTGGGRKVADLDHVGAKAPDTDADEMSKQPKNPTK